MSDKLTDQKHGGRLPGQGNFSEGSIWTELAGRLMPGLAPTATEADIPDRQLRAKSSHSIASADRATASYFCAA
jgi:hypothetical protein